MSQNGMNLRQTAFVAALASGKNGMEAARMAGISVRQACRWSHDADVMAAIAAARAEMLAQATAKAVSLATGALDTLSDIANDTDVSPSARVAACRAVLDCALRYSEMNDLAARVAELEANIHATADTN